MSDSIEAADLVEPAADSAVAADGVRRLSVAGVRRLTPDTTRIYEGMFSLMHCEVEGDNVYRGVFAVRMFPIHNPDRYISLHYVNAKDEEGEIGVMEDLHAFPEETQALVKKSLNTHYYEQIVERVFDVHQEFGLLFFDVQTQRGAETFVMPWRGDRAEEYGHKGRVLLDALDNRYIIPDVEALPSADRRRFQNFIYW